MNNEAVLLFLVRLLIGCAGCKACAELSRALKGGWSGLKGRTKDDELGSAVHHDAGHQMSLTAIV